MSLEAREYSPALKYGAKLQVDARGYTTDTPLVINDADSVTTGGIAVFASNSSDTSTRSLVQIKQDHASASGATALEVWQDGTLSAIKLTGVPSKGIDLSVLSGTGVSMVLTATSESPTASGTTVGHKCFVKVITTGGTTGYIQVFR